jgi:hypothetical protein
MTHIIELKINEGKLGRVAHNCNPNIQEVRAGGSRVSDQPEPHSKTLANKK